MFSSWPSLDDLLPSADLREGLTARTFPFNLLPVLLCYYCMALLVLIPNTFHVRLALLPFTIWSAFRALTTVDLVLTYNDPRFSNANQGVAVSDFIDSELLANEFRLNNIEQISLVTIMMRAVEWTLCEKPLKRISPPPSRKTHPHHKPAPEDDSRDLRRIAVDALDLIFNIRGIGWDWSTTQLPPFTHPTESTSKFLLSSFASFVKLSLFLDILQYTIQAMSPSTFGSFEGGTIFDPSLTPFLRYARSTFITILGGFVVYCNLSTQQDLLACIGVIIFGQHPTQWPPLFDSPWRSTSLIELWGKRWHQIFRTNFIFIGSKPLEFLFGPIGKVFGAFLVSALLHVISVWSVGRGTEFLAIGGFFLMMGVGVVLEGLWRALFGRRVGGMVGWVWTMLWTVGWANFFIDAMYRRGVAACSSFPEYQRPTKLLESYVLSLYRQA